VGNTSVTEVRTLLLGTPGNLLIDFGVLVGAAIIGVATASALLGRLAR
jgi:ABC-2 type transport system permease protein